MSINKNHIRFIIQLIGVLIITIPIFSLVGAAQTSTLEIISDPGGANVYVDDVYKGQTNIDLSPFYIPNIPYGSHIIRIGKSGCNDWSQTYQVSAQTTSVLASLTCPSLLGTFIINSIPDGGGVYIDNNFKGFTPITISDAPYGSHAVKIVKSGYYDWVQNWLAGASPQTITAYLVPLPTPTPTPTPTGTIAVSSDPGGGSVYVDGVYKGLTPLYISQSLSISNVPYGSHVIKITRNGCDDWIQTYQVSAPTTTVLAPLTCAVPTGTFIINSDPSGASVYLDNNYKGTTSLTLTNIPQGSHTIKITKTGYQDWTQTHQTSTGTLTITANLIPVLTPTPTTPTPTPTPTPTAVTPTPTTPTPTPTATPDMGYIYVWSSPAGGSIYVDGNYKGLTDSNQYVIISTTTGYHAVEISKAGYDKYSTSVYVYFGQGTTVNAYLISIPTTTPTPTTQTPTPTPTIKTYPVFIKSEPSGAEVYLDDDYKGITPITLSVSYGNHAIKITKRELGYIDWFDIIQVLGETTVNAVLRLPTFITSTPTPKIPGSEGTFTITNTNYTTEILYRPVEIKTVSYMDRSGIVSNVEIYQIKPKGIGDCIVQATVEEAIEHVEDMTLEAAVGIGIISPPVLSIYIGLTPILISVQFKKISDCITIGELISLGKTDKNGVLIVHIPAAIVKYSESGIDVTKADTIFFKAGEHDYDEKKEITIEENVTSLKDEYLDRKLGKLGHGIRDITYQIEFIVERPPTQPIITRPTTAEKNPIRSIIDFLKDIFGW